jgi:hypothetical protein
MHRNTVADQKTLNDPVSDCSVPDTDFKPFIMNYILKCLQDSWYQHIIKK